MFYARGLQLNSDLLATGVQLKSDTVGNPFGVWAIGLGTRTRDARSFSTISNGIPIYS